MPIYQPRNDFVLFELIDKGKLGKLVMPQVSAQGKVRIVRAVGPAVEGLKVGDNILVIGQIGMDVIALPDNRNLYCTKQANVVLIVNEDDEEGDFQS